ncbi:MAG TPA: response regulator [Chthoniobacterales bacterium]|nr:response regulator [Chthoniobacterales bacterium]
MNTEKQGLSPLRILLAEDERSVAFSVAFALKCDGRKVQIVAEGGQALASVRAEPDSFDLLITDHSMPGMTGVELVQQLREASFGGKILVLSAHLSPENRAAYESALRRCDGVEAFRRPRTARHGHAAPARDKARPGGEPGSALAGRFAQHARISARTGRTGRGH